MVDNRLVGVSAGVKTKAEPSPDWIRSWISISAIHLVGTDAQANRKLTVAEPRRIGRTAVGGDGKFMLLHMSRTEIITVRLQFPTRLLFVFSRSICCTRES